MKQSLFFIAVLLLNIPATVSAQEGYPLDGTWRGKWGMPGGEQTLAVVVMNWDGMKINGRINPGRNTIQFDNAGLDPEHWRVHIEATSKEGQAIVIEGVLEDIGSYHRTITGTWTIGGVENAIVLTRQ